MTQELYYLQILYYNNRKKASGLREERVRHNAVSATKDVLDQGFLGSNEHCEGGGIVMAFQQIELNKFAFFGEWVGLKKNKSLFPEYQRMQKNNPNTILL